MMKKKKHKMLFIPYESEDLPRIVDNKDEYNKYANEKTFSNGFCISPELSLLCHGYRDGKPNPHLEKLGMTYAGACLIIREINMEYVDVPDNLFDQLEEIFRIHKERIKNYLKIEMLEYF